MFNLFIMYNELLQQYTAFTGQNISLDDTAALLVNAYMIKSQYQPTCSPQEQLNIWKQSNGEYNFAYKKNTFTYNLTINKSSSSNFQLVLKSSNRTIKGELNIQKYLSGLQLDDLKESSLKEFDSFMSRTIQNENEPKLFFQHPQQHFSNKEQQRKDNVFQVSPPKELFLNINNNVIGQPGYNSQPSFSSSFIPPKLDGTLMGPSSFNPQPRMPNIMPRYDPMTPFGSFFDLSPMQDCNLPNSNPDLDPFNDPFNVKKTNNLKSNPFSNFFS